ncbi:helix-turn-helix domain-containing protein [Pedobacter sp. BMA]|uniref:helix-turn-helix domain-containing protein n=1 Tax=Pedobacter sp. BMA TaxID=1663685 RepID=UPI0006493864|nr:helix-turn-helix domain-containing protein [Pedobacter sp. BMA]KLT63744.1 AraC family transcriptional regulator [Pedobacter sp. BMA]
MPGKTPSIPVKHFGDEYDLGLSIERFSFEDLPDMGEWEQPERHDRHSFFLIEAGSVALEIDFKRYDIQAPAMVYMHPDQVHRIISFNEIKACTLAVNDEVLNLEYLRVLEEINPTEPVLLDEETFKLLSSAASLCIQIAGRERDQFYKSLLKDHGNALIGLMISCMGRIKPGDKFSRAEQVTKSFRKILAHHFMNLKRPAVYAERLNLSTAYLNECVKMTTGQPVSYHIQQRVILEAKRLICHSNLSLKEVAVTLGYDDYPYFSRLFTKVAGVAPVSFHSKNRD